MNNNIYVDPFDYFKRRNDKNLDGKIVYACREGVERTELVKDPFLVLGKFDNKIYALRLVGEKLGDTIAFKEDQKYTITPSFMVEGKKINDSFSRKIDITEVKISLDTFNGKQEFIVDLKKIYFVKKNNGVNLNDAATEIDPITFNDIIGRYVSLCPNGEIGEAYSFNNWKGDNNES